MELINSYDETFGVGFTFSPFAARFLSAAKHNGSSSINDIALKRENYSPSKGSVLRFRKRLLECRAKMSFEFVVPCSVKFVQISEQCTRSYTMKKHEHIAIVGLLTSKEFFAVPFVF